MTRHRARTFSLLLCCSNGAAERPSSAAAVGSRLERSVRPQLPGALDCLRCYTILLLGTLRVFDLCTTVDPSTHQPGASK
jgi:hypothetical protein